MFIRVFLAAVLFWTACFTGNRLFSLDVYATGLNVKKSERDVLIEWKANTNRFLFRIYRSTNGPVGSPAELDTAVRIAELDIQGTPDKDLFKYPVYRDTISSVGQYYYIVLPAKAGWTGDDFNPNLNYTISPVTVRPAEPVAGIPDPEPIPAGEPTATGPEPAPPTRILNPDYVQGMTIRTNSGWFHVFWDAGANADPAGTTVYYVYRTTNFISNVNQFSSLRPYRVVTNDYVLEDAGLLTGVPYFYTILVNDYKIILPGVNQNLSPAIRGGTNGQDIRVEREIFRKERVDERSFRERFRK